MVITFWANADNNSTTSNPFIFYFGDHLLGLLYSGGNIVKLQALIINYTGSNSNDNDSTWHFYALT